MRTGIGIAIVAATFACTTAAAAEAIGRPNDTWDRYLDYAYIYSSANMPELDARLHEYGREAGIALDDYLIELRTLAASDGAPRHATTRRSAVGFLLGYLASGDPELLDRSVDAIDELVRGQARQEDRYWYRYIHAHHRLEDGDADGFVREVFGLWLEGIAPLESAFDTIYSVSLDRSSSAGFAAALPYLYESVARLVLIRSRAMGVDEGLDPLAAIVRMLHDGRIGAHPRVVPTELSSKAFVDRVIARLDGPASDGGRLSFTLALFDAVRRHETARGLLASEGFSEDAIEATRIASGGYARALEQAKTVLGRSAVYVNALRQLGEIHATKQRLGADVDVNVPFRIEDAIGVYAKLHAARKKRQWLDLGFRNTARELYVETMHGLWAEIQEASMNVADYHLSRAIADTEAADEHLRSAEKVYVRYLALHDRYGVGKGSALVPNSGTFGVYEAAKGFADIHQFYSRHDLSRAAARTVAEHYLIALRACAFDRELWSAFAKSLERLDRSGEFLGFAQPIANVMKSSPTLARWIALSRSGDGEIESVQQALADDRALLLLGFTDHRGEAGLEDQLVELRDRRGDVSEALLQTTARLEELDRRSIARAEPDDGGEASALPAVSAEPPAVAMDRESLVRELAHAEREINEIDDQIEGIERALPLYRATVDSEQLISALRAQREHPAHGLLRRLRREMHRKR